jgi:hypothetical protein
MQKSYNELYRFTQAYDYDSPDKGMQNLADILPNAVKLLIGED